MPRRHRSRPISSPGCGKPGCSPRSRAAPARSAPAICWPPCWPMRPCPARSRTAPEPVVAASRGAAAWRVGRAGRRQRGGRGSRRGAARRGPGRRSRRTGRGAAWRRPARAVLYDLTAQAKAGKIDPVLGRDAEIRQMVDILIRRRQNNPILTGEAGVGKTAVVEGLALRIAAGRRPAGAQERRGPHARPRPAPGRRRREGRVREPPQAVIAEVKASPDADHHVHRQGAHDDRRRRRGRPERRRQPAQAGPGPRRTAHDRGHDLGRIQEILREGCRPRPAGSRS